MVEGSQLEHLDSMAVPHKHRKGLMVSKRVKKPMTKKQLEDANRRDNRKDSSLRKPNEVPGATEKTRTFRMNKGGLLHG